MKTFVSLFFVLFAITVNLIGMEKSPQNSCSEKEPEFASLNALYDYNNYVQAIEIAEIAHKEFLEVAKCNMCRLCHHESYELCDIRAETFNNNTVPLAQGFIGGFESFPLNIISIWGEHGIVIVKDNEGNVVTEPRGTFMHHIKKNLAYAFALNDFMNSPHYTAITGVNGKIVPKAIRSKSAFSPFMEHEKRSWRQHALCEQVIEGTKKAERPLPIPLASLVASYANTGESAEKQENEDEEIFNV